MRGFKDVDLTLSLTVQKEQETQIALKVTKQEERPHIERPKTVSPAVPVKRNGIPGYDTIVQEPDYDISK